MFDVLLTLEGRRYRLVRFKIYQRFDVIPLGKALGQPSRCSKTRRTRLFVTPIYSVPPGSLARI
jgi:hypothetical protein